MTKVSTNISLDPVLKKKCSRIIKRFRNESFNCNHNFFNTSKHNFKAYS